jgi:hypothetical protein
MKQSLIGSDGIQYDIPYFTVFATRELYYQVKAGGKTIYKQLVMSPPYNPDLYINDLVESLKVNAPGTVESLKRK